MSRRDEIATGLDDVRRRIAAAATSSGRDPDAVTLVVVTKFFPASDVRILADLGVTDVGENRHPEAADKRAECTDLDLRWHFIGGLQSNKAAVVASYADVVESVDRLKLVNALNRGAHERSHPVDVLLQVSLDPPGREGRSGADPADLPALADAVEAAGMLALRWHFVGGLQSNKAAAVVAYSDVVESVDRVKLVRGLQRGAHDRDRLLDVLLQVSLDPPETTGRSGADPDDLEALARAVEEAGALRLRGLMAVAPPAEDPATAFARLARVRERFTTSHPEATWLSAGMSGDLEHAISAGATHVRVGSAILGPRPADK